MALGSGIRNRFFPEIKNSRGQKGIYCYLQKICIFIISVKIDDDSGSERLLSSVKLKSDLEPSLVVQTNVN